MCVSRTSLHSNGALASKGNFHCEHKKGVGETLVLRHKEC